MVTPALDKVVRGRHTEGMTNTPDLTPQGGPTLADVATAVARLQQELDQNAPAIADVLTKGAACTGQRDVVGTCPNCGRADCLTQLWFDDGSTVVECSCGFGSSHRSVTGPTAMSERFTDAEVAELADCPKPTFSVQLARDLRDARRERDDALASLAELDKVVRGRHT